MKVNEDSLAHLALGNASRAAVEYGIDLADLDASLALTPLERLILHDQALQLILAMKSAGVRYYGFDPGLVEAVERA